MCQNLKLFIQGSDVEGWTNALLKTYLGGYRKSDKRKIKKQAEAELGQAQLQLC